MINIFGKKNNKTIVVVAHILPGVVKKALPEIFNLVNNLGLSNLHLAAVATEENIDFLLSKITNQKVIFALRRQYYELARPVEMYVEKDYNFKILVPSS